MGDVKWVGNINGTVNAPTWLFTNAGTEIEAGDLCYFVSGELTKCADDDTTIAVLALEDAAIDAENVPCVIFGGGNIFRADYVADDTGCLPGVIIGLNVTDTVQAFESGGTNKTMLCIATNSTKGTCDVIAEPTTPWA